MLTGKRAFEGTSSASLIGNIMNAEPTPLSTFQPMTPPSVDRIVRKCLAKDPDNRWDSAHDAADELRWTLETLAANASGSTPRTAGATGRTRRHVWTAVAALALIAGGFLASIYFADQAEVPGRICRVDLATGKREVKYSFQLADLSGGMRWMTPVMARDADAYAYGYVRQLSQLYAVEWAK